MNKLYAIVYETKCIPTGKIYVGVHGQKNSPFDFDGYLGSGKLLKHAIKKYGEDSFVRRTLFVYDDYEEARKKEQEIVNLDFILRDDTLNISIGGTGGNTTAGYTEEEKAELHKRHKESVKKRDYTSRFTPEYRKLLSVKAKKRIKKLPHTIPNNRGRKHVGVGLKNIIEASRKKKGKHIWITNGEISVHFNVDDCIPVGWRRGRGKDCKRFEKHSEDSKLKIANNPNIRGVKCFTNGEKNIKLRENETVPDGYYPGMTQKQDKMWITDGTRTLLVKSSDEIPCGWARGRSDVKRKMKNER